MFKLTDVPSAFFSGFLYGPNSIGPVDRGRCRIQVRPFQSGQLAVWLTWPDKNLQAKQALDTDLLSRLHELGLISTDGETFDAVPGDHMIGFDGQHLF